MELTKWSDFMNKSLQYGYGGYSGTDYSNCYMFMYLNRYSDCLTRSNYSVALNSLSKVWEEIKGKYPDRDIPFEDVSFEDWAYGWHSNIMIELDAPIEIMTEAENILDALADYPILDEEDYETLFQEEVHDLWEKELHIIKVSVLKDHGIDGRAARRLIPPEEYIEHYRGLI